MIVSKSYLSVLSLLLSLNKSSLKIKLLYLGVEKILKYNWIIEEAFAIVNVLFSYYRL